MKKYNIGLDIGTSSVGWAVVEADNQKILRKGNKPLWAVRLFDEAQKAENRRNFRSTRRRYNRRRERIVLLRKEFEEEINKLDCNFFTKLDESKYTEEDINNKTIKISIEEKEQLKKYLKECPTIYHLRKKLIDNKEKEDIRLVYLAIHHIIKYRGNFLYNTKGFNTNNLNLEEKIENSFNTYFSHINNDYEDYKEILNIKELCNILMLENKSDIKAKAKDILLETGIFEKNFVSEFIKLILGNKFNINKLLLIDDNDKKIEINFDGTDFEDKYSEIETLAGEKIEIIESMKELYDTLFLKKLFKGSNDTNISSLMVNKYNEHSKDLKYLKLLFKSNKQIYKDFFKNDNCIYEQYVSNKLIYDDFIKKIDNVISNIEISDYNLSNEYITVIKPKMENGNFMPRITSTENGKYPYQLNKDELIKIIENQGVYYPFLLDKTNDGTYKIVKLLEFRIPYFVGPLVSNTQSKNAWMERKIDNVKITPYNFDEIVNKELTAENFIKRMISHCTYLLNEYALPNNSIKYNNFKVLNELKQIRINGDLLEIDLQHKIIEDLFKVYGTVNEKKLKNYLFENNEYPMYGKELNITGYSADNTFANNMQSYVDFFEKNGIFNNTEYTIADAENIIEWITIFDDKDILEQKVRKNYPKLSENQIKLILNKKYKGWASLSEKLLCTKYYLDKKSNTKKSILDLMYETKENFMQILNNDKYNFQRMIKEINIINNNYNKLSYDVVESLATSPANKRGIYQALKIVEEIVNYLGEEPENIVIEMAREDGIKERKDTRKKYIENFYDKSKEQINDYNKLQKELKNEEINSQKMFLYFIQEGKCLYCHKPLSILDFKDYEIDHIIPRTLIKDDSIDNKALVHKQCNQDKAASYILPSSYRNKLNIEWWKHLKEIKLISAKKFHNLIRKEYSEEDIKGFINRQLVETRQITKHVANILNNYYKNTKIIYLKAKLSHDYRERYKLYKFREINDYHHAHDAYLAAVLGEYNEKYLKRNINFDVIKGLNNHLKETNNKDKIKYGYVINSLDNEIYDYLMEFPNINPETGEVIETDIKKINVSEFNKTIENTLYRNDILISKKTEIRTGEFYNQTKNPKGAKGVPLKKNMPTKLYGSYTSLNPSYAIMVKYTKKGKTNQKIIGIPIYFINQKDEIVKDNYIRNLLNINENDKFEFVSKPIPFYSKLNWENQICYLVGATDTVEVCNAQEFNYSKDFYIKHKDALQKIFNDNKLEIEDYIYQEKLNNIIKYIVNKMETKYMLFNNLISELKNMINYDNLDINSIEEKEKIIKELTKLLNCKSDNANFKFLNDKYSSAFGKKHSRTINKCIIENTSTSGIYKKNIILGD